MNIDLSKPIECVDISGEIMGSIFQYQNRLYGHLSFNGGTPFAASWSLSGESSHESSYDIRNVPEVVVDYKNDYPQGAFASWHKSIEDCHENAGPFTYRIAIVKRTRRLDAQGNLIGLPTYEAIAP